MMEFLGGLDWATVDFPLENGHDPFFNVNTPADLNEARRRVELP
jgi:molybdopterin-guanine dinucleotide biosynthesis protein A